MANSQYNVNPNVSRFDQDDHLMTDASPARKMFSSSPVGEGYEVTQDNKTGGMRIIKKLAEAIKSGGKLKTPQA